MKISKSTIEVLKNFASTNISILFRPGSELKTMTVQKNVMAQARVVEVFPTEAPIYDLNQFLATASLFTDPDFNFEERSVLISDASGASARFRYAAKETLTSISDKTVKLPSIDASFALAEKAFSAALKAASVMSLPNIAIIGRDGSIFLSALDANNDGAHGWETKVGETSENFKMIYRTELLKFLPRAYTVEISRKMITKFESAAGDLVYYVAAETGSKFD
jgi:hypothetical protein